MKTEDRGPKTEGPGPKDEDRNWATVPGELCDYCGAEALRWRKCKLVCGKCGNIVKSCADL